MKLTNDQQNFVEQFARVDPSMPRAMGLILGYLLVCEPAEQTSRALQAELGVSAGSVSTMMNMLVSTGLVTRVRRPHQRQQYYVIAEGSWQRTVEMRLESIKRVRNVAAQGMAVADNYRMREIWHVYDSFAQDLEQMIHHLATRTRDEP